MTLLEWIWDFLGRWRLDMTVAVIVTAIVISSLLEGKEIPAFAWVALAVAWILLLIRLIRYLLKTRSP